MEFVFYLMSERLVIEEENVNTTRLFPIEFSDGKKEIRILQKNLFYFSFNISFVFRRQKHLTCIINIIKKPNCVIERYSLVLLLVFLVKLCKFSVSEVHLIISISIKFLIERK